jgi:hypothetical protein
VVQDREAVDPHSETGSHHTTTVTVKRRVRGGAVTTEREVWFKGAVFIIEEEVYSESDNSSCYTSEDSWSEEEELDDRYCASFPLISELKKRAAA